MEVQKRASDLQGFTTLRLLSNSRGYCKERERDHHTQSLHIEKLTPTHPTSIY